MKFIVFVFLLIILISFVSAGNVSYYLYDKKVLVEINSNNLNNLDFKIPFDAKALEQTENSVKYITESMIEKSNKGYFFIHSLKNSEPLEIFLHLPEAGVLFEGGVVYPENYEIKSDGRKIILHWNNYDSEQIIMYYGFIEEDNFVFYLIIFILLLFVFFVLH